MELSSLLLLNKPNSSELFLTISSHCFHTFVTSKKSVWRRWTFCVLFLTLPGEPTSRPCYIFIDRLSVLNSTTAVLCMVLRDNLTYVYWIPYKKNHALRLCLGAFRTSPASSRCSSQRASTLQSTYGEECWTYIIPSDSAHPRGIRLTTMSSAQNSKLPSLQNLIKVQHWAFA